VAYVVFGGSLGGASWSVAGCEVWDFPQH